MLVAYRIMGSGQLRNIVDDMAEWLVAICYLTVSQFFCLGTKLTTLEWEKLLHCFLKLPFWLIFGLWTHLLPQTPPHTTKKKRVPQNPTFAPFLPTGPSTRSSTPFPLLNKWPCRRKRCKESKMSSMMSFQVRGVVLFQNGLNVTRNPPTRSLAECVGGERCEKVRKVRWDENCFLEGFLVRTNLPMHRALWTWLYA